MFPLTMNWLEDTIHDPRSESFGRLDFIFEKYGITGVLMLSFWILLATNPHLYSRCTRSVSPVFPIMSDRNGLGAAARLGRRILSRARHSLVPREL